MVAVAAVSASAGDIAELVDVDTLIEVRHCLDLARAYSLDEGTLVGGESAGEEVKQACRSTIAVPATIDTHVHSRCLLSVTSGRGVDEEGHTAPVLRLLSVIIDGEQDLRIIEVVVR